MVNTTPNSYNATATFKRVLITGGNGNLGRLIANDLLALGVEVIKFDIPGTEPDTTRDGESVITGDIRDRYLLRDIFTDHNPDTIIHLASLLSGSSAADPISAWDINANSSYHLLTLAVEFNIQQFFFASTMAT